jgi:hypothetical protein
VFDKLEFDDGAKAAFIGLMSRMHTYKMSREHISYIAHKIWDFIEAEVGVRDHKKIHNVHCMSVTL